MARRTKSFVTRKCTVIVVMCVGLIWLPSVLYLCGLTPTPTEGTNTNTFAVAAGRGRARRPTSLRESDRRETTLLQPTLFRAGIPGRTATDNAQVLPPLPSFLPSPRPALDHASEQELSVICGGHRATTCAACTLGHDASWCHGECAMFGGTCQPRSARDGATISQIIQELIKEYPFQPVVTERGKVVNIVLVRSPIGDSHKEDMARYKEKILFLGICSMEDFPVSSPNPFSANFSDDEYVGLFPGWLHMFRKPEGIFPRNVKLLLQSQSDFALPGLGRTAQKKYDFIFSGTDQDVASDCVGWASFAKNWTFVKQSLEVMCGEYGMTGVLIASKDKQGKKACTIPRICDGKVVQTSFLPQWEFFEYVKQSRFAFVPAVHDASPRAATHALALDTPVLMNWHIMGGWKYVNERTGEFFHDMTDFRSSLQKLMHNLGNYEPRKYMLERYGDAIQGARLKHFVEENFGNIVQLPKDTRLLIPSGA